jgi:hypothetical protein
MTQRIRDWAVVHEMGLRLVQQKNPKGLLYLQTSEVLQKSLQEFEAASIGALAAYRPILRIATTLSSVKLQAFLNIERNFWMILDNKRLTIFRKACASYLKPARAVLDSEQSFEKQHEKLLLVADRYLPDNPLVGKIDSIVHLAAEEAFEAIDRSIFGTELLPCVWAAATLRVSNIQET